MQFHKFTYIIEHIMIFSRGRGHLLYDGGNMTKNRGIKQSCLFWEYVKGEDFYGNKYKVN